MADAGEDFRLGVEAFKSGNVDKAVELLEAATQSDHTNYKALCFLGAAYAAKDRYNAAIGAFKTAEQIAPGVASIHYNIAQAYEASGILDEAEYEYGRALEINPEYPRAKEALAKVRARLRHV